MDLNIFEEIGCRYYGLAVEILVRSEGLDNMEFLCNLIWFCPRQRRVRDNNVCLCEREE